MKTNIFHSLTALAASGVLFFGCASSDQSLNEAVTAMRPTVAVPPVEEDFHQQYTYQAETRSAGLLATDAAAYENMFADVENTTNYSIWSLAEKNDNLSTFSELMRAAGMLAAIDVTGRSFTIFAPTNAAFEAMPAEELEALRKPQNRSSLITFLQAHMLATPIPVSEFQHNQQILFGNNQYIPIKVENATDQQVSVGGATIVKADVMASNGILHVVNAVVRPVGVYDVTE